MKYSIKKCLYKFRVFFFCEMFDGIVKIEEKKQNLLDILFRSNIIFTANPLPSHLHLRYVRVRYSRNVVEYFICSHFYWPCHRHSNPFRLIENLPVLEKKKTKIEKKKQKNKN